MGFKDGCTIGVAEAMCRLASQLNYRTAAEELPQHGIYVNHTTLHAKVRKWVEGEDVCDFVETQALEPSACSDPIASGIQ